MQMRFETDFDNEEKFVEGENKYELELGEGGLHHISIRSLGIIPRPTALPLVQELKRLARVQNSNVLQLSWEMADSRV